MMKRLLLNLICLMVVVCTYAQQTVTITGTVTKVSDGSPVANHDVYASSFDSLLYTFGSATTNAAGVYSITLPLPAGLNSLTVSTLKGCSDPWEQADQQVTVTNGTTPPVNFQVCDPIPQTGCFADIQVFQDSSLTVHFTADYFPADSSSYALNYFWTFGDGTTGLGSSPIHTYSQSGIYTATVIVTGSDSCQTTASISLFVGDNPYNYCDVSILYTPIDSLTFQFSGNLYTNDTAYVTSYSWDFGDGTGSTEPQPVHTYQTGGFYNVTLTVTTSSGCVATTSFPFSTDFPPFPNCEAYINYVQTDSSTFSFTGHAFGLTGDTTNILSYTWDFGDGTTGTGVNPTHIYAQPGLYSVQLVATTADSCIAYACIIVCDFNTPVDTFTYGCQALFGVNMYADSTGNPFSVGFYDWSIGGVKDWHWDFGDSTFSSAQNPIHLYPGPGFYTVSLSITTWSGCQSSAVFQIYVGQSSPWGNPGACQAFFIPVPDSLGGNGLQFFDLSYSPYPILSWSWDFGDGATSHDQNPYHVYNQPGNYTVSLTIAGDSCNSVISFNINSLKPWDFNQKPSNLGQSSLALATSNVDVVSGLKLLPNPVVDNLHLAFNADSDDQLSLQIHDMSGRVLADSKAAVQTGANVLPVQVSQLVPGLYFLEIRNAKGVQTVKFVKQ